MTFHINPRVLFPSRYMAGGKEPPLVADFVRQYYRKLGAQCAFSDLFTFGRASAATYVDSSGVLQTASSGSPRTGHHVWNGSSWVNKGLRLESAAATNLVTYSRLISNWTNSAPAQGSTTDNVALGVDGGTTMSTSTKTGTSDLTFYQSISASSGNYVWSFYVLKDTNESRFPEILLFDVTSNIGKAWHLNTKTGATALRTTIGAPTNNEISVTDRGTHWFIYITMTVPGSVTLRTLIRPAAGTVFGTYSATTTGSLSHGFHQLETGLVPSSYIATAGSTATRAAETLTIAGADMPYSATAMSFAMKGALNYADNSLSPEAYFFYWGASDYIRSGLITVGTNTGAVSNQRFAGSGGGLSGSSQSSPGTLTPGLNKLFNIASRHGSTFLQGAVGGTALTTSTTPTAMPNISSSDCGLATLFNGTIDTFRAWGADIAQAGIEEASS